MNEQQQICPLCGEQAHFYPVDYGNRKFFRCPTCTYFQVSLAAERELAQMDPAWRLRVSEQAAHAPEGSRLVIVVPSNPPGQQQVTLSAEYVPAIRLPG